MNKNTKELLNMSVGLSGGDEITKDVVVGAIEMLETEMFYEEDDDILNECQESLTELYALIGGMLDEADYESVQTR